MLDRWALPLIKKPLHVCAEIAATFNLNANQVTVFGFFIGMMTLPALAFQQFDLALILILLNRISDGIDGELARLTKPTDQGAFLDIVLDFIFYSAVIFGFALANPDQNALVAAALIFAFIGTGSSFLAFSVIAERRQIKSVTYPNKGIYYMAGLAEGTETVGFFVFICLWPEYFVAAAWVFAAICYLTTAFRVWAGYRTLAD